MLRVPGLFAVMLCISFLSMAVAQDKNDAKIDGSKLVGIWILVKGDIIPVGTPIEFTKDGKLTLKFMGKGKEIKIEGTYKVDGDKLTVTTKKSGKEKVEVNTIKTLTKDKLVFADPEGKEIEFKKKAAK